MPWFIFGLIIFGIICWRRLEWSIYLILVFLPSYLLRFKIGEIPFTFLEGIILMLVVVWIIKKIQGRNFVKTLHVIGSVLRGFRWPILLFLVVATISAIVSPNKLSAWGDWKAFFIEPLIFLVIFLDTIRGEEKIKKIFLALGLSALGVALFTIYQIFTGFLVPLNYLKEGRMTGFYEYPAGVGLYLAPIAAMFIGFLIEYLAILGQKIKNQKSKIKMTMQSSKLQKYLILFSVLIVIFSIIALLATKTEGAYVGVLAATFLILLFTPWRKWAIVAVILLAIIGFSVPASRNYLVEKMTFSDVSGDVRLVLWQGTFNALKHHPIFGGGLSGFPKLYQKYKEDRHVEILKYPHNVFLNFWTETGILGLIAFVWLMIAFFYKCFKNLYKLPLTAYKLSLIAAMLALLIYGLLDVPYFKNDLSILFWVILGSSLV